MMLSRCFPNKHHHSHAPCRFFSDAQQKICAHHGWLAEPDSLGTTHDWSCQCTIHFGSWHMPRCIVQFLHIKETAWACAMAAVCELQA